MALIQCPECGKQLSEHASQCSQCGTPMSDIIRLIKEQQEQELRKELERQKQLEALEQLRVQEARLKAEQAAEEARLRAEQAAEEARLRAERQAEEERLKAKEEARERAEKRAKWWKKNKVKVIIVISVVIAFIIAGVVMKNIAQQKTIVLANQYIAFGESCAAIFHFDEANRFYQQAKQFTEDYETRLLIDRKKDEYLPIARKKADEEYDNALKRLKILLEADDYVFNEYSNQALDKMIEIYPERKETIYYKNMRE